MYFSYVYIPKQVCPGFYRLVSLWGLSLFKGFLVLYPEGRSACAFKLWNSYAHWEIYCRFGTWQTREPSAAWSAHTAPPANLISDCWNANITSFVIKIQDHHIVGTEKTWSLVELIKDALCLYFGKSISKWFSKWNSAALTALHLPGMCFLLTNEKHCCCCRCKNPILWVLSVATVLLRRASFKKTFLALHNACKKRGKYMPKVVLPCTDHL